MIDLIIRLTIPTLFLIGVFLVVYDYKKTEKEIEEYNKLIEQNQLSAQSLKLLERIAK